MVTNAIKLLSEYGWAAMLVAVVGFVLLNYLQNRLRVWYARDKERTMLQESILASELLNHQFFVNIAYKLKNDIPILPLDSERPTRKKMFRKLIELEFLALYEVMNDLVEMDLMSMEPSQWANVTQAEIIRGFQIMEERALQDGIPPIVINKFNVWHSSTTELLHSYINDLAINPIFHNNVVRTNTLLYLMNLKLVTLIGDAERTIMDLNGEISGKQYKGELIE